MSGIFGIYHPDSRPIEPSHLQGMAEGNAHRGPDGTKTVTQHHIGFGHSMLHTTPESLSEVLPYIDPESGIVITADARIDNREELFNKLGIQPTSTIPDSHLILYTYKKWGPDAFPYLLGDFAFVIWDNRTQQLLCVRDYIGVKPFYFHDSVSQFLFSSEIKQLAEHPDIKLTVNEDMVAEYLSFSMCSKTQTLFSDIKRLSPGHYLSVTSGNTTTKQYWKPKFETCFRYKNTSDYTEHFLDIFKKAVSSRLRSNLPISAELSGGLDSSTVVGMACRLLRERNKDVPKIYAMVFPGLRCDEKLYINSVSNKLGVPVHCIPSHHYEVPPWQKQIDDSYDIPDMPNFSMRDSLINEVSKNNSRVLLSGIGGDEWFTGSGYPYLDCLKEKKYSLLINEFYTSFSKNKYFTLKRFILNIIWPLIPVTARRSLCKPSQSVPDWLGIDFQQKTNLRERILKTDPRITLQNLGDCLPAKLFLSGTEAFFLESMDRYHAKAKIEYRSPFLDRRVAEFATSIPTYEHQRSGQIKLLLRNQSNDLLPETIRTRQGKAVFSFFFGKAFSSRLFIETMNNLTITHRGWVDPDKFRKSLRDKQNNFRKDRYHSGNQNWETWFVFAMEIWHRSILEKGTTNPLRQQKPR